MDEQLKQKIKELIDSEKVFLFMKGSPVQPQCGFSFKVVEVLRNLGTEFQSFDVLSDNSVREGIKQFANWPTIPQLYVKGKFVGGSDIVQQMFQSGELQKLIE